jgi:hypothetical protein
MAHFNGGTALPEKRLPQNIKSLAIVNRTQPPFNIFNNIATGTIYGYAERPGVPECLNSMNDGLFQSNFYRTTWIRSKNLKAPQSNVLPRPLSGIEVQAICKEMNTDALLSLETFDVFPRLTFQNGVRMQMDNTGKDYPINIVTATQEAIVTAGWRVYNAMDTTIADEYSTERNLLWKADGINEENARTKLPVLPIELKNVGAEMGLSYVNRISPKTEIIYRYYYGKENDELKKAKQFIVSGNWDAAKQIWLQQANSTDKKIAGRGVFNLAIIYEKAGDINAALDLAEKAYVLYKNKYTDLYVKQLRIIKNGQ